MVSEDSIPNEPRRGRGRPPSRIGDVVMPVRLTHEMHDRLKALAELEGRPAYQLLQAAFAQYWEGLPKEARTPAKKLSHLLRQARELSQRARADKKNQHS